ncbi:MAG: hypothetical protein LBC76_01915 [Treponema sp.]|jgi:hypothetical protein|nr:hypothetical protein [Treponema sp.]
MEIENIQKYVRIQVRYTGRTGKPVGIFGACHHVINNSYYTFNTTDEEKQLFLDIEKWFNENLPNPPFYEEGNPKKYITWFKTKTTKYMIEKLIPLINLLEKYNIEYDIVYTNFVGKVVYEDNFQVAVE